MMWSFLGKAPVISVDVINTLTSESREPQASIIAVLDTGYAGFIMLPEELFDRLQFSEQRLQSVTGRLADGSVIQIRSAYGTVSFPDLGFELHGRVQTCDGAEETLLGMDGIQNLAVTVDCCAAQTFARVC